MKRALHIVAAVFLVVAIGAADNPGCKKNPVQSDRPASERKKPDPQVRRELQAIVSEASGPYTVTLTSWVPERQDSTTDKLEEQVAGGRWSEVLYYTAGDRLEVHLHVQGNAADTFACLLWDGAANRDSDRGKGEASCALVTEQ